MVSAQLIQKVWVVLKKATLVFAVVDLFVQVSQGMSISTHQVGVGHGGPSDTGGASSGDIQSILQRAIRPDNSSSSSQTFTIGQSSRGPTSQPLHLSIGSASAVVSQPLQIPMNEH